MANDFYYPPSKNAVQKTLSAQLLNTAGNGDPITFSDVDGIQNKPGVLVINRVDVNAEATPAKREFISYSGTSGNTVVIETRNVDGSASAKTHDVGAIVEFIPDVVWAQRLIDQFKIEHNVDGTHDSTKVAMLAGNQTLTGTKIFDKELVAKQLDTPSSPSSGYNKLYFKNDDKLYKLTSGGTETEVGATSGGDWTNYTAVTPTSGTLDSPSFEFTFAGVDLSTTIYPGMRLKVTQGTVKYFIVTKVAFSTNTTITAYGGTDYSLVSTGTTAITAFAYSSVKAPAGFPLDPTKWTVEATDTSSRTQATPGAGTWYNLGSVSISIPIGIWDTQYKVNAGVVKNASTVWNRVYTTLSTANNSATDADLTAGGASYSSSSMDRGIAHTLSARKNIVLTTKTTHYLNTSCESASTTLYNNNDLQKLIIRAVCAYL